MNEIETMRVATQTPTITTSLALFHLLRVRPRCFKRPSKKTLERIMTRPAQSGIDALARMGADVALDDEGQIIVRNASEFMPFDPVIGCTPTGPDGRWIRREKIAAQ